jgi:hypothetical protein
MVIFHSYVNVYQRVILGILGGRDYFVYQVRKKTILS